MLSTKAIMNNLCVNNLYHNTNLNKNYNNSCCNKIIGNAYIFILESGVRNKTEKKNCIRLTEYN